ncbi:MAG: PrsW family glutamic-type intramembrane protease, partial [Lachnospiraceae bacterium]|nr:PrsW family glutamic-type intramembrane protease [Lachnospiraceae bacterium]
MANTEFYDQIYRDVDKISWKDVFSECGRKHTKEDREYALLAGTSVDTATEATMLRKWQKPWLFLPLLLGGAGLIAAIYLVVYACIRIFDGCGIVALNLLFVVVPPLIFPLVLMVFFWELNIPRNISIWKMLGYFLVGGMMSIFVTLIVGMFTPEGGASYAPFSEEPGKLLAALVFLWLFSRSGKKVYGMTGLAIGAAVGAGFGGFESAQYAYNMIDWSWLGGFYIFDEIFGVIVKNELLRGVLSLGGHTLFCAPYAAAVALHMKDSKLSLESFLNVDFAITFGCSFLMHFLWNSDLGIGWLQYPIVIVVLWFSTLYITRKCFRQVVEVGRGGRAVLPAGSMAMTLTLQCVSGPATGAVWQFGGSEVLVLGRDAGCTIKIPGGTAGVSKHHCS